PVLHCFPTRRSSDLYDLLIRPAPELSVKVVSVDPITGIQTTNEAPLLDNNGEIAPGADSDAGLAHFAESVARTASAHSGSTGPSSPGRDTTGQSPAHAV